MRFMFIIKGGSAGAPPAAMMEAMHDMALREIAAGRMCRKARPFFDAPWDYELHQDAS